MHYLSHTCLVVCAEQGGAVGGDEGFPLVGEQLREVGRVEHKARDALQGNRAAVVVFDDLRLDIGSGCVRSGVHVGNEADCRHFLFHIGRDACHHIAVLVEFGLNAHSFQLTAQQFQQVQLFAGARLALGLLVRLGVHCDVSQEFLH